MIYVVNKRRSIERIIKEYPKAKILDVTSASTEFGKVLSPFYPHYSIPVPQMSNITATCVEAVWQGLKVFESAGVDYEMFQNDSMANLKRTVRKYGKPLGHMYGNQLIGYLDARIKIYLPIYKYVLENIPTVKKALMQIKEIAKKQDVVLLDYNTNIDITNTSKPLSHAGIVKLYIECRYPIKNDIFLF